MKFFAETFVASLGWISIFSAQEQLQQAPVAISLQSILARNCKPLASLSS
jgi:hypothetical protein